MLAIALFLRKVTIALSREMCCENTQISEIFLGYHRVWAYNK